MAMLVSKASDNFPTHVNFVVAGVQKGGTRALRQFLEYHPEIGLSRPSIAETHFFDKRIKQTKPDDYTSYHALYEPQALACPAVGDITPIYIFDLDTHSRIHTYNPDMKIIVLLRDPVARAYSQWAMEYQRGTETRPFFRALLHEWRVSRTTPRHPVHSYVQRGFYAHQLHQLFKWFPRENCLILRSEDLKERHAETLTRVCRFLGVSADHIPQPERIHVRAYTSRISRPVAFMLRRIFAADIRQLEGLMGWNCRVWRRFW